MTTANRVKLGIVIFVIGFSLTSYSVFLSTKSINELMALYNSKIVLQQTYFSVRDAERAQRIYLLTGDREYLKNFRYQEKAVKTYNKEPLNLLINKKLLEMNQTILLKEEGKSEQALSLVQTKVGENYMTMIEEYYTKTLKDLDLEEQELLTFSSHWHNGALVISSLMSLVSIVMLIAILFRTRKN